MIWLVIGFACKLKNKLQQDEKMSDYKFVFSHTQAKVWNFLLF